MINYFRTFVTLAALLMMMPFSSCSDSEAPAQEVRPQIEFLFSLDGIGDDGYNDCILSGVERVREIYADRCDFVMHMPQSNEEAEKIFKDWLERQESDAPSLCVLASSDYSIMVAKYLGDKKLPANKRLLVFEDDPDVLPSATTFTISSFGASFLCGVAAARSVRGKALVVLSNPNEAPVESFRAGFQSGFEYSGRNADDIDVAYMADDWHGYVMAEEAYQNMQEWSERYDYIFPVAGGTNLGIYRYTRENPDSPLICGIDVDQSHLSPNINGCVLKHIDMAVEEHLSRWLETGELPESRVYGLEDGYSEWLASSGFENPLLIDFKQILKEAIRQEKIYYDI